MIMSVPPSLAITVDGIKDVGEWNEDWNWNQMGVTSFPPGNRLAMWQQGIELENDPKNDSGPTYDDTMAQAGESSGYDIMRFYSAYDPATDTAYGLAQVYGLPADLDADGDPDNDCVAYGDCDGMGDSEIVIIRFIQESLGTNVKVEYRNNTVTVDNAALDVEGTWDSNPANFIEDPDDNTQPRAVYELSIKNFTSSGLFSRDADDSPIEIKITAGGLEDIPGEDIGRAFLWFPTPKIDIVKYVQGMDGVWYDANTPATGPVMADGSAVSWKYEVQNTGDEPLENVVVTDDQGVAVNCPQDTLDVGETMTCTATGTVPDPCDPYANMGYVEGVGVASGITVTDEDPAHYACIDPEIDIVKYVKGNDGVWYDANTPATGPVMDNGSAVSWKYVVTNTGDEPLENVVVTDDQGVAVNCPQDTLDVGETMTCTATGTVPDPCDPYANMGYVEGVGVVSGITVTDEDQAHYSCPDVPALTPAGLMALIGILGMIGIVGLKRRD